MIVHEIKLESCLDEREILALSDKSICKLIRILKYGIVDNDTALKLEHELAIRWEGNPVLNKETHPNGRMKCG